MAGYPIRDVNGFTPTQARIMALLADGTWHSQEEVLRAIDEHAEKSTLGAHLSYLRKILTPRHEVIACQRTADRGPMYMFCRSMSPMING